MSCILSSKLFGSSLFRTNFQGVRLSITLISSKEVCKIFEPVAVSINQLVDLQIGKVKIKRMIANHPKGKEIKVRPLINN